LNEVIELFKREVTRKSIVFDKKPSVSEMTPEADHKRLSDNLGITVEEAEEMVDKFYLTYPAAVEWARLKINPNFRKGK